MCSVPMAINFGESPSISRISRDRASSFTSENGSASNVQTLTHPSSPPERMEVRSVCSLRQFAEAECAAISEVASLSSYTVIDPFGPAASTCHRGTKEMTTPV